MELNILHLYPDCMSLYGEYANVAVLCRHLEQMGVTVNVKKNLLDYDTRRKRTISFSLKRS